MGNASDLLEHLGLIAFIVALTPIFSFFFLRDSGTIVAYLIDRLRPIHIETTVAVWCEIDRIIGKYLRGLALDALVIGALATIGLWLVGAPYPLLLGAFTTLVNPLPYLGTILSVGVAAIVSIANGQPIARVGWIVAVYVIIRILDDHTFGAFQNSVQTLANDVPSVGASVWTANRGRGERITRELRAERAWINEHMPTALSPAGVAEFVDVRMRVWEPSRLRDLWWYPYDESLARTVKAVTRYFYGRESERLRAVREGVVPAARLARRLARDRVRRS